MLFVVVELDHQLVEHGALGAREDVGRGRAPKSKRGLCQMQASLRLFEPLEALVKLHLVLLQLSEVVRACAGGPARGVTEDIQKENLPKAAGQEAALPRW